MMKIEIARSYARKINTGNFENADFFCSVKAEVEVKDLSDKTIPLISEELDKMVQFEVGKSVNRIRPIDRKKIKDSAKEEAELDAE